MAFISRILSVLYSFSQTHHNHYFRLQDVHYCTYIFDRKRPGSSGFWGPLPGRLFTSWVDVLRYLGSAWSLVPNQSAPSAVSCQAICPAGCHFNLQPLCVAFVRPWISSFVIKSCSNIPYLTSSFKLIFEIKTFLFSIGTYKSLESTIGLEYSEAEKKR